MKYGIVYKGRLFAYAALALSMVALGCSGGTGTGEGLGSARATFVLSNDSGAGTRALLEQTGVSLRGTLDPGPVPLDQIESLVVQVDQVILEFQGASDGVITPEDIEDDATVLVSNFEFFPTTVVIPPGGVVRWVWTEDGAHTVTSGEMETPDGLFENSADTKGDFFDFQFPDPGEYPYFSNNSTDKAEGMSGVVIVDGDLPPAEDDVFTDDVESRGVEEPGDNGDDEEVTFIPLDVEPFDVDIVDLLDLSLVLSSEDIPAGKYRGVQLRISNPRLRLVGDAGSIEAGPYRENVKLTANGRLFLRQCFEVPADQEVIISVDLGGIHLVNSGNSGKFVLTPQVRVEYDVDEAEVEFEGEIISKDDTSEIIEVDTGSGIFEVIVTAETRIFTDDDSDDAPEVRGVVPDDSEIELTFADLAVGQMVEVEGTLVPGEQVVADSIEVDDADIEEVLFAGAVTEVDTDADTLSVDVGGSTETFEIRPTTEIKISSDPDIPLALGDLVAGMLVEVEAFEDGDGNLVADEVEVEANENVSGEITAVDGGTQTITVGMDEVAIVAGTEIRDDVVDTLGFADLAMGQMVQVDGVTLSDGTFIARRVDIEGTV